MILTEFINDQVLRYEFLSRDLLDENFKVTTSTGAVNPDEVRTHLLFPPVFICMKLCWVGPVVCHLTLSHSRCKPTSRPFVMDQGTVVK